MLVTPIKPSPETITQRIVLSNISWQTYESLLAEAGDKRSSRFSYSQGVLEIIMPSDLHETVNCLLKQFVTTLSDELKLKRKGFGSTTLNREDLKQGAPIRVFISKMSIAFAAEELTYQPIRHQI
ncbi:hypothetical protein [Tychonema sp. LEGE 07203]|uniref:hypothetical protein n=1 Tax=Tychonema sp. LEGE 07203 TaxID=1828671 RepID=UPI001D145BCB|nr:hypothetical protein [Tychonema sp. LEGE 07203]